MNKDILAERVRMERERGDESLQAAELTLKQGFYAEAISSAYYAAFHYARAALLTVGQDPSTHQGVMAMFGLHLIKTGKIEGEFHKLLMDAKEAREDSDYDVSVRFPRDEAEQRVDNARRFVERIKVYLSKAIS